MAQPCTSSNDQNYVVGRGRLFFDKFVDGCNNSEHGEMYFGNTPELSLSSDTETLDHYSSDYGMREKT
ncbi:structural protein [Proteus phage P16-2532]|nr:structural protein [Proteus phage P16-2532]